MQAEEGSSMDGGASWAVHRSSLDPSTQPLRERSSDTGPTGSPIVEFLWNDAACHHTTDTLPLSARVFRDGCD